MRGRSHGNAVFASFIAVLGYVSPLSAQLVARATYVNDGSFELGPIGLTSPQDPVALAVGTDGSVHVVDRVGGLVFVFGSSGTPERSYGGGQLGKPMAIAFDDRGAAYVLDGDPNRVQVFEPDGEWWYTIGSSGRGPAGLQNPIDVAVGPNGFVYVLNESGPAVRVFGRDGVFVRGIDLREQIEAPVGLAVDGDGTILVTSKKLPDRVFQLPPFSDLPWGGGVTPEVFQVGASGETVSVATDGRGTVVVLDSKDGRLWGGQRLRQDAPPSARPIYGGVGTGRGSFRDPVDLAFSAGRDVLILDRTLRKIERIGLSDREPIEQLSFGFPIRVSQLPPDLEGAVIDVLGPAGASIRFAVVSAEGRNVAVTEGVGAEYADFFGNNFQSFSLPPDSESGGFRTTPASPPGDLVFNDTLLVVAEPGEDRFSVFDLRDGSSMGTYGDNYEDDRRLDEPRGVDLFSDGSIVVADYGNDRVAVFSADLASLLGTFPFPKVQGVAISPAGGLFAWDDTGQRVAEIPLDGAPAQVLPGALVPGPVRDMAFDAAGNIFLLEVATSRVTVLDSSREKVFVRFGGRDADFKASHLSVDDAGNVYVASAERGGTLVYRWDRDPPS
jgi:DNA-binding beta-propeller fold protein YncE